MQTKPQFGKIVHNTSTKSPVYKLVRKYNKLITQKPTTAPTLAEKLAEIRAWEEQCRAAYKDVYAALHNLL